MTATTTKKVNTYNKIPVFLAISYTKKQKVEKAIRKYFDGKNFTIKTGRENESGIPNTESIKDIIKSCKFGIVVYNELKHNISYEWGLLDTLLDKIFLLKDENINIDLEKELPDKNGRAFTPLYGEGSEEDIIRSLEENEGLQTAIKQELSELIFTEPSSETEKALEELIKSNVPFAGNIQKKETTYREKSKKVSEVFKKIQSMTILGYFYRANINYYIGELDKAIQDYNKAISLNLHFADAFHNRGFTYYEKGDFDKAILDFNKFISINPNLAEVFYNRGFAYYKKGDFDKAIEDYDKTISLDPNFADAFYNRGNTYYYKKGDFDSAIQDYDKAISINPNLAEAFYNRGNVHSKKGNLDNAIQDYDKAIEIDPKNETAWFNKACAYSLKGDKLNVIKSLSAAINLDAKFKEQARQDKDFEKFWTDKDFKKILD